MKGLKPTNMSDDEARQILFNAGVKQFLRPSGYIAYNTNGEAEDFPQFEYMDDIWWIGMFPPTLFVYTAYQDWLIEQGLSEKQAIFAYNEILRALLIWEHDRM